MDARIYRAAALAACLVSLGASHRTPNFLVTARTAELSREVAEAAETYRRELALEWLGHELPQWNAPCPITVDDGPRKGAGGATSFMFDRHRPFGWTMAIQGSRERILDSVLPHEITHTIFATHFGRPLPRWADEGACTTVEHESEKQKQKQLLVEFLMTKRGIAFDRMFAMKEYPVDILPLYSQGYSLARYLIAQGGKQKFVAYVGDGMRWNNWTKATQQHYGIRSLRELQDTWLDWVRRGSPPLEPAAGQWAGAPADAGQLAAVRTHGVSPGVADSDRGLAAAQPVGWYARVRDKAVAIREAESPDGEGMTGSPTAEGRSQSLARQQPIGRPQQRVLEWTRAAPLSTPARTTWR